MTDITCRIIIAKGQQYYRGTVVYGNGNIIHRFSPHIYDAKKFANSTMANCIAKALGGRIVLFDALSYDVI